MIVVAAAIIDPSDYTRVLMAQRRPDDHMGSMWEYPGGKVEVGEQPAQALVREMHEELGVDVAVGGLLARLDLDYGGDEFEFMLFRAVVCAGTPQPMEGQPAVQYVTPAYAYHHLPCCPTTYLTRRAVEAWLDGLAQTLPGLPQ